MSYYIKFKDVKKILFTSSIFILLFVFILTTDLSFEKKISILIIFGIIFLICILGMFQVYDFIDENTSEEDEDFLKKGFINTYTYPVRIRKAIYGTIFILVGITELIFKYVPFIVLYNGEEFPLGITLSALGFNFGVIYWFYVLYDPVKEKIDFERLKNKEIDK